MVSALGIVIRIGGIYCISGYSDPWGRDPNCPKQVLF